VLSRLIRERGTSVHVVGSMLGVSDRAMYNYFRRERRVPMVNMVAVANYFDMDVEELVDAAGLLRADPGYTAPDAVEPRASKPFDDGWGEP
jgi:predicted transcriptional regulator